MRIIRIEHGLWVVVFTLPKIVWPRNVQGHCCLFFSTICMVMNCDSDRRTRWCGLTMKDLITTRFNDGAQAHIHTCKHKYRQIDGRNTTLMWWNWIRLHIWQMGQKVERIYSHHQTVALNQHCRSMCTHTHTHTSLPPSVPLFIFTDGRLTGRQWVSFNFPEDNANFCTPVLLYGCGIISDWQNARTRDR